MQFQESYIAVTYNGETQKPLLLEKLTLQSCKLNLINKNI